MKWRWILIGVVAALAIAQAASSASGSGILFQATFRALGTGATDRSGMSKMRDSISIWDFGCVGNGSADDTVCLQNALAAAAAVQGELVFSPTPAGVAAQFRYTTALIMPVDIMLRGIGPKFGVQLRPDGVAAFLIRGSDHVVDGSFAFRVYMENLTIWPLNTPASTKIIEIKDAYSIHFEHVWMFNVPDNSSIGWDITDASDVVFDRVVAYGVANTTSKGVVTHSSGGAKFTSVDITRPDFESFNHAFENNDSAVMTIFDPYMERNVIGVDNNATTSGRMTLIGGAIHGTNNSTQCVRSLGNNTFIFGTLLNPGTGTHRLVAGAASRVFYHDTSANTFFVGPSNVSSADLAPNAAWQVNGTVQALNYYHARLAPTYGVTVAIDSSSGDEFVITPTDGVAFTISTPINTNAYQRISIRVKNTFGVLGAITMGAGYKLTNAGANAFPVVANGFSRTIDFEFDLTNWIETSRTPNDVPN